jgi:hypothetical protein
MTGPRRPAPVVEAKRQPIWQCRPERRSSAPGAQAETGELGRDVSRPARANVTGEARQPDGG